MTRPPDLGGYLAPPQPLSLWRPPAELLCRQRRPHRSSLGWWRPRGARAAHVLARPSEPVTSTAVPNLHLLLTAFTHGSPRMPKRLISAMTAALLVPCLAADAARIQTAPYSPGGHAV